MVSFRIHTAIFAQKLQIIMLYGNWNWFRLTSCRSLYLFPYTTRIGKGAWDFFPLPSFTIKKRSPRRCRIWMLRIEFLIFGISIDMEYVEKGEKFINMTPNQLRELPPDELQSVADSLGMTTEQLFEQAEKQLEYLLQKSHDTQD